MLDTRTKILSDTALPERLNGRRVVAAYIDPLTDTHTARWRELAAAHGPLVICVCDPPSPLLPATVRAELAAACRDVEFVAIGEQWLAHARVVVDEREGDLDRRAALIDHVRERQKAAPNA